MTADVASALRAAGFRLCSVRGDGETWIAVSLVGNSRDLANAWRVVRSVLHKNTTCNVNLVGA